VTVFPDRGKGVDMQGYEVRTIDGDKIGHVVDEKDGYLIIEHGLRKTKHALPHTFVEVDEGAGVIRTTLAKAIIYDSPKVNGEFEREVIAEHYGLAEGFEDPPTRGFGDLEPDDPAFTEDRPLQEIIAARKEVAEGEGPFDEPTSSPGVTGGDRRSDYPREPRD
jgi:hypothetical protein